MSLSEGAGRWWPLVALSLCVACETPAQPEQEHSVVVKKHKEAARSLLQGQRFLPALKKVEDRVGGDAQLLELRIAASEIRVQVQNRNLPKRIDEFRYENGEIKGPFPVELKGSGVLSKNLFPLSKVHLDELPKLLKLAVQKVDPQDGKVERIVLRRNYPLSDDVRFRIFVESPRRKGYLDATEWGHPIGIN